MSRMIVEVKEEVKLLLMISIGERKKRLRFIPELMHISV